MAPEQFEKRRDHQPQGQPDLMGLGPTQEKVGAGVNRDFLKSRGYGLGDPPCSGTPAHGHGRGTAISKTLTNG